MFDLQLKKLKKTVLYWSSNFSLIVDLKHEPYTLSA